MDSRRRGDQFRLASVGTLDPSELDPYHLARETGGEIPLQRINPAAGIILQSNDGAVNARFYRFCPQGRKWDEVDTQRLKELIELMDRNQLEELEVVDGEQRVRLRKKPEKPREVVQVAAGLPAVSAVPTAPAAAGGPAPAAADAAAVDPSAAVLSPMVGTFYRAPGPGAEPFVEEGDQVEEGQVLCIVEAMKVLNEVKAEKSGVIGSSLVEDGTPVEFGQPLFSFS